MHLNEIRVNKRSKTCTISITYKATYATFLSRCYFRAIEKKEQFLPIKSGIIKLHIQYNYTTLSCGLQVFAADFVGEYYAQFL